MTRLIVTYGDPILRKPTQPVTRIDEELNRLIDEMVETIDRKSVV